MRSAAANTPRLRSRPAWVSPRARASAASAVNASDGIIAFTFTHPYATTKGSWSHGVKFRTQGIRGHTVFAWSDTTWCHWGNDSAGNPTRIVRADRTTNLVTAASGNNTIRMVSAGHEGWFFLNASLLGKLYLTGNTHARDVSPITRLSGAITIPVFGAKQPLPSGTLARGNPEYVLTEGPDARYADLIAEARFTNPAADWTCGFLVRQPVDNFYAVVFGRDGYWQHPIRTGTLGSDQIVIRKASDETSTAAGATNTLNGLAIGDVGALFVNRQLAGSLDPTGHKVPGRVKVISDS